jgi:glycosyltransferase involved in cell wall biosynthesis
MSDLAIYILCHDRPEYAQQAIRSVLAQTSRDFTLIVSDNSSNDEVERMVRNSFPGLAYVRRQPMLPALEHFNCCIDEAQGTHICLFHDDDLMASDFVQQVHATIALHVDAIAIGCNARIESNGQLQVRPSFLSREPYETISSACDLATRYFGRHQSGIAPFPCYVYQRSLIGHTRFNTHEGKYSDVTWLLRLAERGRFVWINQPLMTYRLHGGNDGLVESRRDRLRFLGYLKRHRDSLGVGLLADYRCSFIYKPFVKAKPCVNPMRLRLAQRFLHQYSWLLYARASTYRALWRRALVKRMALS